jgi:hypothetical protein
MTKNAHAAESPAARTAQYGTCVFCKVDPAGECFGLCDTCAAEIRNDLAIEDEIRLYGPTGRSES